MSRHARSFPFRPSLCFALLLALLASLWLAGGASRADVLGQVVVRSVAWGALVLAALFGERPALRVVGPILIFVLLALALTLLQLVPLPPAFWQALPGRSVLAPAAAGLDQPWRPLTMTPGATANAASSLIVPLAVLILLAGSRPEERDRLPAVLLILVGGAMLVGLMQFSGARLTNPLVNDTAGQVSGNFANRNHFALFLAIGCLLAPVWAFSRSLHEGRGSGDWRGPLALALIALFALTILATGSRAGIATGLIALVVGLLLVRREVRRQLRRAPRWVFPAVIAGVVTILGVLIFLSITADRAESINRALSIDVGSDMRRRGLPTVLSMIATYFPAGAGIGGFDPMFRIHEPMALLKPTYFNHAHNDFLEIVLDSGLPGFMLMFSALGWWAVASVRAWRGGTHAAARQARLGSALILLVIVASTVDYPARTPMMMATIAIAGVWLCRTDKMHRLALPMTDQLL